MEGCYHTALGNWRGQNIQWKLILQMFKGVVLCYTVLHNVTLSYKVFQGLTSYYRVSLVRKGFEKNVFLFTFCG